jgi:PAP2 superfamily
MELPHETPQEKKSQALCWKRELGGFAAIFACFPIVAWLEPGDPVAAVSRAERLVAMQRSLGLDVERSLHQWVAARPALLALAEILYLTLHVTALVGVLVWLAATRPNFYRRVRNLFAATHVLTIAVYLSWPTAPPRLLEMTSDEPRVVGGVIGALQYEYAAVPSGHVAFGLVYPVLVTLLVVVTEHHLVFDAIVAAITVTAAAALVRPGSPPVMCRHPVPVQEVNHVRARPVAAAAQPR